MKSLRVSLLAGVFLTGLSALFALPEIRDCQSEYYDITGESGSDLLQEMKTKNGVKGGFFAVTNYNYKSKCKDVTLTCKVRLPRWSEFESSANNQLKQKWEKFYVALVAHEQGHVDIFNAGFQGSAAAVENLTCKAATSQYSADFKKVVAKQKAYDAETDHGKKLGATFGGSTYMGIAYSQKSDVLGWAYDAETKDAATKVAMKNCKAKDCKLAVWASGENRCVSLARGEKGGYGYALGEGREDAETKSVASCTKFDKGCAVRKTVCAGQGPME